MKIAYIQNNPVFGNVDRNLKEIRSILSNHKTDVLVLPELFATGYLFRDRQELITYSEQPGHGPVTTFLQEIARDIDGVVIGGFAELSGEKIYNSAALVSPQGLKRVYRKIHLFDREKLLFDETDNDFWVEDIGQAKIGVMICFDWFFPEAARTLALRGADIIVHPSNLVLPHCPEAMKTRALENRVFTVTANRVGTDDRGDASLSFIGQSRIYSPTGKLLAGSADNGADIKIVDISVELSRSKQVTTHNDLFQDRRSNLYDL